MTSSLAPPAVTVAMLQARHEAIMAGAPLDDLSIRLHPDDYLAVTRWLCRIADEFDARAESTRHQRFVFGMTLIPDPAVNVGSPEVVR